MAAGPEDLDLGTAGAGARREAGRRRATREEKVRAAHPHIGGTLLRFQMPPQTGSRANIDHIAVAASGVFVIDAKRYKGRIEVRKPLFGDAVLVIAGRKKTKLVEGFHRQVEAVKKGLAIIEQDVPVAGCFCFLNPPGQAGGSGLPLFRTLTIDGVPLYYPRHLSKRLNQAGPVDATQITVLAEALVELFPSAARCNYVTAL